MNLLARATVPVFTCGCLVGLMGGCDRDRSRPPSPSTSKRLAAIKDQSASDVTAYANAHIVEQIYLAGNGDRPKPTAIDSLVGTVPRNRKVLVLFGYCPNRDIDSYSVFFINSQGRLCEIVKKVSEMSSDVIKQYAILQEVPLSHFDDYSSAIVTDVGDTLVVPRETQMAIAFHAKSGVMGNAVAVREQAMASAMEPATQEADDRLPVPVE